MAEPPAISDLRTLYRKAVSDEPSAKSLQQALAPHSYSSIGVVHAYRASAEALLAYHSLNPFKRLKRLRSADRIFLKAIRLDPTNPEIRFLRFAIHSNLPDFLSSDSLLTQDKQLLLARLGQYQAFNLSQDDLEDFIHFFRKSGLFTEQELSSLPSHS